MSVGVGCLIGDFDGVCVAWMVSPMNYLLVVLSEFVLQLCDIDRLIDGEIKE